MKIRALQVLLFLASSFVYSQNDPSVGLVAGAVLSKPLISDDPLHITSTMTTFASAGALVRIPLEGRFFIQAEPAFLRKGLKLGETFDEYKFSITASADYVELPVMLGLSLDLGTFSPYLMIGPSVSYKVFETWDIGFGSGPPPDFYSRYDVSLNGGAGVLYRMSSPVSLLVEARYSLGLNQVNAQGSGQMHSSDFRLGAGLMFNL